MVMVTAPAPARAAPNRRPAAPAPPRAPKLSHRKSRFGCQRCRQRRVKCNEAKPVCNNCGRHRAPCFYDRVPPPQPSMVPAAPFGSGTAEARVAAAMARPPGADPDDPPETRERRLAEVRLMHQYVTQTGATVAIDDKTRFLYASLVPQLALKSDALLYCMYWLAALHLAGAGRHKHPAAVDAHRNYLSMALREHNKALATMSAANADIVCLTSCLFRVSSFVLLQERARRPYEPPVEWLMMSASATAVVTTAYKVVDGDPDSVAHRLLNTTPVIHDERARFGAAWRRGLEHLVRRDAARDAAEPWDAEVQDAYETTLSYIGGAVQGARRGEAAEVCRRLIIFPMLVKGRFIELVQERRPRAIVLLAYYFALLSLYRDTWWIGDSGGDEVRALAATVAGDWRDMMKWPLDVVASGKVPSPAVSDG